MRQWYIEQSSNRYAVYGDVTDWTLAPNDACTYDDDLGGAGGVVVPDRHDSGLVRQANSRRQI